MHAYNYSMPIGVANQVVCEYSLYMCYAFINILYFFLSFDAKLINASLSGGNVTLWMTVAMDLMSLTTVVSILNVWFRL